MNSAYKLLIHCRKRGMTLRRKGDQLAVQPVTRTTPGLLDELRKRKPELLDLLDAELVRLPEDCLPWLHIARQILAGEFDGGDGCLLYSLLIGVQDIPFELCRKARARLTNLLGRRGKEVRL